MGSDKAYRFIILIAGCQTLIILTVRELMVILLLLLLTNRDVRVVNHILNMLALNGLAELEAVIKLRGVAAIEGTICSRDVILIDPSKQMLLLSIGRFFAVFRKFFRRFR